MAKGGLTRRPRVALLPWGDLVEDFLDPIGVSLDGFCAEMSGGWLFGYVEALATAGVDAAIVCVSGRVPEVERRRHAPTGAPLVVIPASRAYLRLRASLADPYGWSLRDSVGDARGPRALARLLAREAAPYLATPPLAVGRELRRLGTTAILVQEYEYPRFDVCVALGAALGIPVVATFQAAEAPRTWAEHAIRPATVRRARAIIAAPAREAERVSRRYGVPDERIARIPNPLDVAAWTEGDRAAAREELGFPDDAVVVAWHGRVEIPRKGVDVLLDAWERLLALLPTQDLRLLLVGTGADAEAVRTRVGTLPGVTWVDEYVLDKARVRRLLAAADVYAFPSRHEGFPVAPIEALASGLPVVAADAPGVAEILPDGERSGGIVVAVGDAAALADGLARLGADAGLRAELGRRARDRAEGEFSLEAVGRRLRAVIDAPS